jgi:NAD(P)-dependent dehydrogenase (short-subunit alcohol dehydrogenase family)
MERNMERQFTLSEGFHAVVIGGAGGIGSSIARQFLALGASVTATGVDQGALDNCTLERSDKLLLWVLDVTSDEDVLSFASSRLRVDALINCAGILARDKEFESRRSKRSSTSI